MKLRLMIDRGGNKLAEFPLVRIERRPSGEFYDATIVRNMAEETHIMAAVGLDARCDGDWHEYFLGPTEDDRPQNEP